MKAMYNRKIEGDKYANHVSKFYRMLVAIGLLLGIIIGLLIGMAV